MKIHEQPGRLTVTHGSYWVLGAFALGVPATLAIMALTIKLWGFANEVTGYIALGLCVLLYGLFVTRVSTITVLPEERRILWQRRGLIPRSGEVPFDQVDRVILATRRNKRGTAFYRVMIAQSGFSALPVSLSLTRDLNLCLDVVDRMRAALGRSTASALIAEGRRDEAERLVRNEYGADAGEAGTYIRHLERPPVTETDEIDCEGAACER